MSEAMYSICVVAAAFLIFGIMLITSDQVCHKWIGPWFTGGDITDVFALCEGR
jgi:hypothetical protein